MADLSIDFCGIKCLNPFWLASAPPANTGQQIMRAFDAGWGGAVWKTLGDPITNVSSRFASVDYAGQKMMGLNNIELITDRPLEVNLKEIAEVKRRYPKHVIIASLMVETRENWREIVKKAEDSGADGLELNFGCPHGMCERGMGSAVGQEPKVLEEITRWVVEDAKTPVIVKLTPNTGDINEPGEAAARGGAHAISLINTIKSLMGLDLDRMVPLPRVQNLSTNGGYCGPAVKPIALFMVSQIAKNAMTRNLPISGIGGIGNWRDAAEFIALGATSVQVCTAVMHHGYRVVEDMIEGLSDFLDSKGMKSVNELRGQALGAYAEWGELDLDYSIKAKIDPDKCIGCNLCYVACMDGAHQCIHIPGRSPEESYKAGHYHLPTLPIPQVPVKATGGVGRFIPHVDLDECVGCNLCALVCPVPGTITMEQVPGPLGRKETWNDRVAQGRDLNPGAMESTILARKNRGT
ncbi:MAG: NAD-dependent dihydropyrimidine dehydrogenase subunit PreA [Myxococcota bacterium]|nr:NAD-dependent dihydropyrimidine dehydrogenase subunit PreA [Myxococcota bacterium]